MATGIRTKDLRKIYNSPPPLAAGGALMLAGRAKGPKGAKKPKTEILALDGVSLEVEAGEIFGLLGPNGAGKSTTVGILTTRVKPTSGEAWIGPHDVWQRAGGRQAPDRRRAAAAESRFLADRARDSDVPRRVLRDPGERAHAARLRASRSFPVDGAGRRNRRAAFPAA